MDTVTGGLTLLDRERRPAATGPLATGPRTTIAGDVVSPDALWSCTTCMHCVDVCPVGIEHVPTIVQLRRGLVDQGIMSPTLQQALQNMATRGELVRALGTGTPGLGPPARLRRTRRP